MLRISKLSDYGIVLLTHFARAGGQVLRARDVAAGARMPLPTVSKLCKALSRAGLLASHRGMKGGYSLAKPPDEISIAQILAAIEGPVSLTECTGGVQGLCVLERLCPARGNWRLINQTVLDALAGLKLSQMTRPLLGRLSGVDGVGALP